MKKKQISGKKKSPLSRKATTQIRARSSSFKKSESFPIVAIGASSGGLEAMTQLLKHLPAVTGMAFIFVQHLSPDRDSMLVTLLSRSSKIPVHEVKDKTIIEPDNVYVMPSDKEMVMADGKIKLTPRSQTKTVNLLVDVFFTSLAENRKENVIGIILSGNATDGTSGMKAIKMEGGLTFAQDDSAKFNSMPRSAIAAGVVDFVLSPAQIAKELIRLSKHPYIKTASVKKPKEDDIDNDDPDLKFILDQLYKSFGVNFRLYKMNTVKRRIIRRLLLNRISLLKGYANSLNEKKEELNILFNDLLINLTKFFREPETCKYLKATLFPRILKTKKPGEALRIWVTACSTGEEAYSIAMMLLEIQDTAYSKIPVQIFATDLSANAISKARIGVYSRQEVENVSPKRLQRFFTGSKGGYRIAQVVRDICVFAPHNVLSDPPFSRMDFISCCNLLIYFDTAAQKKALATFHYALLPDGFMVLGKSETIGASGQLFSSYHKKLKLYVRKKNSGAGMLPPPDTRFSRLSMQENIPDLRNKSLKNFSGTTSLDTAINALLLSKYVPASVVINHQMEILQFRGATSLYLEHPEGRATLNILKMARPEISFELRNAISRAMKSKKPVQKKGIELNGGQNLVTLEAVPLNLDWEEPVLLILFTRQEAGPNPVVKNSKNSKAFNERKIIKLEEEMSAYRDELHSISHNHEAAIEELQSANEEVVSSNEELRSINEELETSKEEIQSANEELATTNQELQARNELLNESYDYSEAIISTIHDPMIVLDEDFRVKTANKSFYRTFHTNEEETEGILFYELGGKQWNNPDLRKLLEDIISKNSSFKDFEIEQTFPKTGPMVLRLNAKRVVQRAHREKLILLAIADVTDTVNRQRSEKMDLEAKVEKQTKIALATSFADAYIRSVFMQAPVAIVIYKGPSFIIDMVNEKGIEMWGSAYNEAIGKPLFEISPELKAQGLEKILTDIYASGKPYVAREFSARYVRDQKIHEGFFNLVLNPIYDINGRINSIAAIGADITQEVIARRKIEESESRYHNLIYSSTSLVAILRGEYMIIEIANDAILQSWGKGPDVIGKSLFEVLPEIAEQGFEDRLREVYRTGKPFYAYELPVYLVRNGQHEVVYYTFVYQAQSNINGEIEGVAIIANEVTPQAIYRKKIKQSELRYSTLTNAITQIVWITDSEGKFVEPQEKWTDFTGQTWEDQKEWGWINMLHEDDRNTEVNLWKEAVKQKAEFKSGGRVWSKKHDSFRYFESVCIPLTDEQHHIKEWVCTITDVHESRIAAEKLKEAARQFRFIADAMPQKVWTADAEGNRNYFNQQWTEYAGLELDELKSLGIEGIVHPDDLEKTLEYWKHAIATGNKFELEIRLRGKDGVYRWHLSRGQAHRNEKGEINMWVGTDTEIQKQKLQVLEFEDAVLERTKELQQKNVELRKMNKELESFAYVSSHDLQEPLRKIQIYVQRIMATETKNLTEKGKEYFNTVAKASDRMQTLIEDLLEFSRISMAKVQVETTDLACIIDDIKAEHKEIIEEKGVTIEVRQICNAQIIPFQFHQLMENLISNAIKFGHPDRSPHITIECKIVKGSEIDDEHILNDQNYCHLSVADNGIGFEHEFEEQVFELFQRLHGQDEYPGTGIGLAIVKKIVENHNGIIKATSEMNVGTRFDIYLPTDSI